MGTGTRSMGFLTVQSVSFLPFDPLIEWIFLLQVTLNIRQCLVMEFSTYGGTLCEQCPATYYNVSEPSALDP